MSPRSFFLLSILISVGSQGNAQRLDRFGGVNRISYNSIGTFFSYADSSSRPDEVVSDTGYYYMYFWLSDSVREIGTRIFSPVPEVIMPDRGDQVSENYYGNEKDKSTYFDPWIALERAEEITAREKIPTDIKTIHWTLLGFNDDSPELFPQPTGNRYNALLRVKKHPEMSSTPLTAGLYRVRFTGYKKTKVKGGFLIQVGTTEQVSRLKLVKRPEELKD
jgi:hypothetical protein